MLNPQYLTSNGSTVCRCVYVHPKRDTGETGPLVTYLQKDLSCFHLFLLHICILHIIYPQNFIQYLEFVEPQAFLFFFFWFFLFALIPFLHGKKILGCRLYHSGIPSNTKCITKWSKRTGNFKQISEFLWLKTQTYRHAQHYGITGHALKGKSRNNLIQTQCLYLFQFTLHFL